jgi:hypothetical protein
MDRAFPRCSRIRIAVPHLWCLAFSALLVGCGSPAAEKQIPTSSSAAAAPSPKLTESDTSSAPDAAPHDPDSAPLAAPAAGINAPERYVLFLKKRSAEQATRRQVDAWLQQSESGGNEADEADRQLAQQMAADWTLIATAPLPEIIPETRQRLLATVLKSPPEAELAARIRRSVGVVRADDPAAGVALLRWAELAPQGSALALTVSRAVLTSSRHAEVQLAAWEAQRKHATTAEEQLLKCLAGSFDGAPLKDAFTAVSQIAPTRREVLVGELELELARAEISAGEASEAIAKARDNPYRTRMSEIYREAFNDAKLKEIQTADSLRRSLADAIDNLRRARRAQLDEMQRDLGITWPKLDIAAVTKEADFDAANGIADGFLDRALPLAAAEYYELSAQLAVMLQLGLPPFEASECRRFACLTKSKRTAATYDEYVDFLGDSSAAQLDPNQALAFAVFEQQLGDIAFRLGKEDEAQLHQQKSLQLIENGAGKNNTVTVEKWLHLARTWTQVDEPSLALRSLQYCGPLVAGLKAKSPQLAVESLNLAAQCQLVLRNPQGAVVAARQAVAACGALEADDPLIIEAHLILAQAHRDCDQFDASNAAFQVLRAFHVSAENEQTRRSRKVGLARSLFDHELGMLRLRQGRLAEAEALFLSAFVVRLESLGEASRRTAFSEIGLNEAVRKQRERSSAN